MKASSNFQSKILFSFVAASLVVGGLAAATWKLSKDAETASHWVSHTQDTLNSLAEANIDALNIELSTQNFRISGDLRQLALRDAAILKREATLKKIKNLIGDDPRQQDNWSQLNGVIQERLTISREVEMLRKTEGLEAATAFVARSNLSETTERMYRLLSVMQAEEIKLMQKHDADQLRLRQQLLSVGTLFSILLLVLFVATYIVIRRQMQQTEASQRALTESEENLSITLQSIGDAVLATDTEGRITRMNPVAERLTGWIFADARGKPIDEVFCIVHEVTREPAVVPIARVLATGEIQGLANHTVIITRDGHEYPIADSAAPIRDASGEIRGAVLVFRDVTIEHDAQNMIRNQQKLLEQRVEERTRLLHESEEHLRSVINNVPALIAYINPQQRYVYVNQQYQERFASGQRDLTGCSVRDILGVDRYAIAAPHIAKVIHGESASYDWQPFPGIWQTVNYVPKKDASGQLAGYYVLGMDITDRKMSEARVRELNAALEKRILEIEHVSRALKSLSATNRAQLHANSEQVLLAKICESIVVAGGYHMAVVWYRTNDEVKSLSPVAESGCPGGLEVLLALRNSWGVGEESPYANAESVRTGKACVVQDMENDPNYVQWRPYMLGCAAVAAFALHVGGEVIGSLAIYSAVPNAFNSDEVVLLTQSANDLAFGISSLRTRDEQRKTQEAIRHMMRYDALTGLPNETLFSEALISELETSKKQMHSFAILQTNIEGLSAINLSFGFSCGDQLLREFGLLLRGVCPESAMVARLRSDEFAILLPDCDREAAVNLAEHVEHKLQLAFRIGDISLDVSARIGVVIFPDHGLTENDLLRNVDIAVAQADRISGSYAVFDPTQNPDYAQRLRLAGELRRGIDAGELRLYLQPKVDMATARVCGAEALVRWMHPARGLIPPVEFISLAEHSGLIDSITGWVIESTLRLMSGWQAQGFVMPISVNLSARNLRDQHLPKKIREMLTIWKITPNMLELEVTESAAMEDPKFALSVLNILHDEGILLSIDDFGTGYSSLSYLQRLPMDYIKIDQSFVRDMSVNKESSMIVRSTIDLVHDLGRKAIAEGVETLEDWEQLAVFGCDIAQGYLIAKPMPSEEFPAWVSNFQLPPSVMLRNRSTI